jgi:transposase-like protein
MQYSEGFKARMIQKMLEPAAMSACGLSRETGVPQGTLSRWLRKARKLNGMSKHESNGDPSARRPQDWSADEKLEAVLLASSLSDEELGAFLREKGLHEADLVAWRKTVLQALKGTTGKRKSRKQTKETRRIRELEKELDRKEKALAEAAALLVLKKKVQAIWGDEDGSTSGRKGS